MESTQAGSIYASKIYPILQLFPAQSPVDARVEHTREKVNSLEKYAKYPFPAAVAAAAAATSH